MPIPAFRAARAATLLLVLVVAQRLDAQQHASRDSLVLERQARQIARLDSELTVLRREVRRRAGDSATNVRVGGSPPAPALVALRAGGLLQVWYAQGDGGFQNTFRIRRAELKLGGDLSPRARWAITLDGARVLATTNATTDINGVTVLTGTAVNPATRVLVDAYVALALPARLELDAGQVKIPFGFEGGVQSPALLETVERALYTSDRARGGIYGDSRDVGLLLRAPTGRDIDYAIGYFNGVGESQNDVDRNAAKAAVGRLAVRMPFLPALWVGGSGALSTRSAPDSIVRQRGGVEARLFVGPLFLKTEYVAGRDGIRHGEGWYAHAGYSPTPQLNFFLRQDVFDPDRAVESSPLDARERDWITGFTYDVPVVNVRFQMNYLRKSYPSGIVPGRDLVLTNIQAAW